MYMHTYIHTYIHIVHILKVTTKKIKLICKFNSEKVNIINTYIKICIIDA